MFVTKVSRLAEKSDNALMQPKLLCNAFPISRLREKTQKKESFFYFRKRTGYVIPAMILTHMRFRQEKLPTAQKTLNLVGRTFLSGILVADKKAHTILGRFKYQGVCR